MKKQIILDMFKSRRYIINSIDSGLLKYVDFLEKYCNIKRQSMIILFV